MRTLAFLALSLIMTAGSHLMAEPSVRTQTYVCPKCGKLHVRPTATSVVTTPVATSAAAPVTTQPTVTTTGQAPVASASAGQTRAVSYEAPMAATSQLRASGGVSNVLAALNA